MSERRALAGDVRALLDIGCARPEGEYSLVGTPQRQPCSSAFAPNYASRLHVPKRHAHARDARMLLDM